MKKSGVLAIATMLIGVFFAFSSCEQTTSTELEESFKKVKEVTPIAGAQNSTMDLKTVNQDSYFSVTLEDGSNHEGWCIEWNEASIEGVQNGVNLYSTKGHEKWKEINYFLGIKDKLRAEDPSLTYKEIQAVIWSLIDNPSFDVDKVGEYENIDPIFIKDGEANFDVAKVKNIVAQVNNYFTSNKSKTDSKLSYGVLLENNGQTIMVGNETAYAYGGDYATCFLDISNLPANNWGWTNGPLAEGEYDFPIYAGAGQCNLDAGTLVGRLLIDYSEDTATITYEMTETSGFTDALYTLLETHLFVSDDDLLPKKGTKYTSAPGQFGNVDEEHDNITEFTYTIEDLSGDIWVAAHSVVSGFEPPESL